MKTESKGILRCFAEFLGNDYKYYKIVDEQDLLEAIKDERTGQYEVQRANKNRTGPIKVEEITSEEFNRIRRGE